MTACQKPAPPFRSEPYRRLVAALPCINCRIEGASQAAHPNSGKAKGRKSSDLLCFPLCHVGANDCHGRFDRYELHGKARQADLEPEWAAQTKARLFDMADYDDGLRRRLQRVAMQKLLSTTWSADIERLAMMELSEEPAKT